MFWNISIVCVAGLKAAITAAQRGHHVVLCEKSHQLGGILKSEQAVDFKHEMFERGLTLEKQAQFECYHAAMDI